MDTNFVITNITKLSDTVVRVDGVSVDGNGLVVDILTNLCANVDVGNTLQLRIGEHSLEYCINAQVVALGEQSMLASYGGFILRLDGGLRAARDMFVKNEQIKLSLLCHAPHASKRARIAE